MFTRNLIVGKREITNFTTYSGVNNYISNLDKSIWYIPGTDSIPTDGDFVSKEINEPVQNYYLKPLAEQIKALTPDKDEQARIAISIVQMIPYDWEGFEHGNLIDKYPYEVIHTAKGVCGEKSKLIIYLLRDLGFGTAYFVFEEENHATAGIKCPKEYSYMSSGYCFIEATDTALIGQSNNNYVNVGQLSYHPAIYTTSNGLEYQDIVKQVETAKQEIANGTRYAVIDASGSVIARMKGSWDMVATYPDVIIKYPD
jgi:hypothetical protein